MLDWKEIHSNDYIIASIKFESQEGMTESRDDTVGVFENYTLYGAVQHVLEERNSEDGSEGDYKVIDYREYGDNIEVTILGHTSLIRSSIVSGDENVVLTKRIVVGASPRTEEEKAQRSEQGDSD